MRRQSPSNRRASPWAAATEVGCGLFVRDSTSSKVTGSLVVLEFEDLPAARRWYESEVYQDRPAEPADVGPPVARWCLQRGSATRPVASTRLSIALNGLPCEPDLPG